MKLAIPSYLESILRSPERIRVIGATGTTEEGLVAERWLKDIVLHRESVGTSSSEHGPRLALIPREAAVVLHLILPSHSIREAQKMVPFQIERGLPVGLGDVRWTTTPFAIEGGTLARVEIVRKDVLERCQPSCHGALLETWAFVPLLRRASGDSVVTAIVTRRGVRRWVTVLGDQLLLDEQVESEDGAWDEVAEGYSTRMGVEIPSPTLHLALEDDGAVCEDSTDVPCAEEHASPMLAGAAVATLNRAPVFAMPERGGGRASMRLIRSLLAVVLALSILMGADQWRQARMLRTLRSWRAEHGEEVRAAMSLRDAVARVSSRNRVRSYAVAFESLQRASGSQLHLDYVQLQPPNVMRLMGWAAATSNVLDFAAALEADSLWADVDVDMIRAKRGDPWVLFEARASFAD